MIKNLFILPVVIIIIIIIGSCSYNKINKCDSCDNNKNINVADVKNRKLINFKHIKDFSISFSGDNNTILAKQIIKNNNFILINYFQDNSLVYFDIEKKTTIRNVKFPKGTLSNFYRHNKDSIFLLYRPELRENYNHDSTLLLTDEKGKILKFYGYDDANVKSPKNKNKQEDSLMYLNQFYPFVYENNKLFITFSRFSGCVYCLGGEDFFKIQLANVGYVDLQKNKFIRLNKISYPYLNDSTYYPSGYNPIHLISLQNNKDVLVSFEYTPLVYKYNYITDSLTNIKGFKSVFKDSIYASSDKPETAVKIQRYSYNNILFDKENNRFIRYFHFPYKKHLSSLIFTDSLFNVTAEGINPKGYGFITSISKDTLLFYNYKKSLESSDSIYYSLFVIDENTGLTQKVYSEFMNNNSKKYMIKDFVKNITKTDKKNYAAVIIPIDFSCPGCVTETLNFFYNNIKKISEIPVYLIISSEKEKNTKEVLKKYNIYDKSETVFFNTSTDYFNYHPDNKGYNPRLMLVENNKVTKDKIYDVKKIRKLQEDLMDFLLKYKFIKGYK